MSLLLESVKQELLKDGWTAKINPDPVKPLTLYLENKKTVQAWHDSVQRDIVPVDYYAAFRFSKFITGKGNQGILPTFAATPGMHTLILFKHSEKAFVYAGDLEGELKNNTAPDYPLVVFTNMMNVLPTPKMEC